MIPLIKKISLLLRIGTMKRKGRYDEALLSRYRSYTGRLLKKKIIDSSNADSMVLAEEISGRLGCTEAERVARCVRKAAFSDEDITKEEYRVACEDMTAILKIKPVRV
jgi:hypothetical protein